VILMFHRVRPWREQSFAPNRHLEITPDFLEQILMLLHRERFEIIPLDEVPQRLKTSTDRQPFAVITFDDGYRDTLEYAWPILRRYNASWTLFVVAEFAEGRGQIWWHELEEAIARLDRVEVAIDHIRLVLDTESPDEKSAAFDILSRRLKGGTEERLLAVTSELVSSVGLEPNQLVRDTFASWDEISALARDPLVTVGSHTLSHPILSGRDRETAVREIVDSKAFIEYRLGVPVRHMAYPFGNTNAVGLREFDMARDAGYVTSVTTRPGHVFPKHARQLTALPRVSVNGLHQSTAALRALLSGVPFLAWDLRPLRCRRS
jgi:peptidoglycan/xylan/chitin deacetylase (PgdA/CDA1 family)